MFQVELSKAPDWRATRGYRKRNRGYLLLLAMLIVASTLLVMRPLALSSFMQAVIAYFDDSRWQEKELERNQMAIFEEEEGASARVMGPFGQEKNPSCSYAESQVRWAPEAEWVPPFVRALEAPIQASKMLELSISYQLEYALEPNGEGYLFRAILNSEAESAHSLPKSVCIVLDNSQSTSKELFESYKRAASDLLVGLREGDFCNFILLDQQVEAFSEQPVRWNGDVALELNDFLDQLHYSGVAERPEHLLNIMEKVLETASPECSNSLVLLWGREGLFGDETQRQSYGGWTRHNKGQVALYGISCGSVHGDLQILTKANRGGFYSFKERREAADTFRELSDDLQHPLAVEVGVEVLDGAGVSLAPEGSRAPNLYLQRPYVLYGSSCQSAPFDLMVRGIHRDEEIQILQSISLDQGVQVEWGRLLREWSVQRGYDAYARFLQTDDLQYLEEARSYFVNQQLVPPY